MDTPLAEERRPARAPDFADLATTRSEQSLMKALARRSNRVNEVMATPYGIGELNCPAPSPSRGAGVPRLS